MSSDKLPVIKCWDGTPVHESADTFAMQDVVYQLRDLGFEAQWKNLWSMESLHNGHQVYVAHTRRVGSTRPYGVSQTDAERWQLNMFQGRFPANIVGTIGAHGHTVRGSLQDDAFKVINLPCFTSFMEYAQATASFAQWQTDIGGKFIFVTKEGRWKIQDWLYRPFTYNSHEDFILEGNCERLNVVDMKRKPILEPYLQALVDNSKFKVALTADFHLGERVSIAPKSYHYNGVVNKVDQTLANRRIYNYWKHYVATCKEIGIDEIWVVGDALAGAQVHERTHRNHSFTIDVQKAMFVEVMAEFLK